MSKTEDNPTYSFTEAIDMILNIDSDGLKLLSKLLEEEKKEYCLSNVQAFRKIIEYRYKELMKIKD